MAGDWFGWLYGSEPSGLGSGSAEMAAQPFLKGHSTETRTSELKQDLSFNGSKVKKNSARLIH